MRLEVIYDFTGRVAPVVIRVIPEADRAIIVAVTVVATEILQLSEFQLVGCCTTVRPYRDMNNSSLKELLLSEPDENFVTWKSQATLLLQELQLRLYYFFPGLRCPAVNLTGAEWHLFFYICLTLVAMEICIIYTTSWL